MRIEGTRVFEAPPETVFAALVDPQLVASTVPGIQDFTVDSPERWHGAVRLPVGPRIAFQFELAERNAPHHAVLVAHGKTFGGSVRVSTAFELEPVTSAGGVARGATLMRYTAQAQLSGLLGRLGDTALKPVGELQVSAVMRAVERHIAAHQATGTAGLDG